MTVSVRPKLVGGMNSLENTYYVVPGYQDHSQEPEKLISILPRGIVLPRYWDTTYGSRYYMLVSTQLYRVRPI